MTKLLVPIHRILALILGAFIFSHLAIHLTAILGINHHISTLNFGRYIYRNRIVEPILLFVIVAQIGVGIRLIMRRWAGGKKGFWGWAQIISGIYLVMFFVFHTGAALGTRYLVGLDTNFYWAAGTLSTAPRAYIFAPYYFFAVVAIFTHLAAAIHFRFSGKITPNILIVLGVVVGGVIVVIFSGAFFEIVLPFENLEYIKKYLP